MRIHPKNLLDKIGFEQIRSALLDQTRSPVSRELAKGLTFASAQESVEQRLAETGEMLAILESEENWPLNALPDVREHLGQARAEGSILSTKAIMDIYKLARMSRLVRRFLTDLEPRPTHLSAIATRVLLLKPIEKVVTEILNEYGEVKDNASPELRSIRKNLNKRKGEARQAVNRVMERVASKGMASDEGITIRGGRTVIPIRAEFKRKIDGFVHDVSASGQTVYLEPVEALTINNEIRQLEIEEKNEIERLLKRITSVIRSHRDDLSTNSYHMAQLDLIAAKARLGRKIDGVIPTVTAGDTIVLRKALNPVLKLKNHALPSEKRETIIPLDLEMEPEEQCLMITGPNAGGKSVAMKTLGLSYLMTQSGIPIPADEATRLPILRTLMLDMGDDQSIESDLSTFSSRLQWIRTAVAETGSDSLILIDEAGSGTDPEEGGALYQALIETIIEKGGRCIVTTHHGSLKVFAHEHPNAVNGSMEFDAKTLSPTYRFHKGIPGSSYAFEIATRMELQEPLVERARELVGASKGKLEDLITDLEAKVQKASHEKERLEKMVSQAQSNRDKLENKLEKVRKERDKLRVQAIQEAQNIIGSANQKVEAVIEEIREKGQQLESEDIKKARREIDQEKKRIKKKAAKAEAKEEEQQLRTSSERPEPGDTVKLKDSNTTGELVELDGKNAVVLANGLRLKTKITRLEKVEGMARDAARNRQKVNVVSTNYNPRSRVKPSLEVRGMRGDEAMKLVTRYIDDALATGMNQIEIIHGKGEGILKKLIHEYLDQRREVRKFYLAPLEQGGAGCTIVEL